jgi:hypothetical protein
MRTTVDLKCDTHGRRGRLIGAGGDSGARKRGQQQRGGSGLDDGAPGNLISTWSIRLSIEFVVVHDCSMFVR